MAAQQQQKSKFAVTIARFMTHALNQFYCRGALGTTVNPDTIGSVWSGEFDLNTLRKGGGSESGKTKLRIQNFLNTCGRGLSHYLTSAFSNHDTLVLYYTFLSPFNNQCAYIIRYKLYVKDH